MRLSRWLILKSWRRKKWRNRLGRSGSGSSASYLVDKQYFKRGQKRPQRIETFQQVILETIARHERDTFHVLDAFRRFKESYFGLLGGFIGKVMQQ